MHVTSLDVVPKDLTAELTGPALNAAPATDSYALVLVDLGSGVNLTAAQGMTYLNSVTPSDKSFADYYNEVSYGKYQVTGDVIGPYPFTMTTCDTTGMYQAIEPMITGTYNHLIYYFNDTNLCTFGGLGEEGSVTKPAKRTWMNGSLSCVVLMQEPGHNLGLMHANTIKCGTSSFSTTPATDCTITEYGSAMSTMGGGCQQFNAYERWYMQWLSGCNGVRVPGDRHVQPAAARDQLLGRQRRPGPPGPLPGHATGERSAGDATRPSTSTTTTSSCGPPAGIFDTFDNAARTRGAAASPSPRRPSSSTPATTCASHAADRARRRRADPAEQRLDRAHQHDAIGDSVHRPHGGWPELHRSSGRRDHHPPVDQRDRRQRDGDLSRRRHRLAHLHRRHDVDGARPGELRWQRPGHWWHQRKQRHRSINRHRDRRRARERRGANLGDRRRDHRARRRRCPGNGRQSPRRHHEPDRADAPAVSNPRPRVDAAKRSVSDACSSPCSPAAGAPPNPRWPLAASGLLPREAYRRLPRSGRPNPSKPRIRRIEPASAPVSWPAGPPAGLPAAAPASAGRAPVSADSPHRHRSAGGTSPSTLSTGGRTPRTRASRRRCR